jgi:hypothetical protein
MRAESVKLLSFCQNILIQDQLDSGQIESDALQFSYAEQAFISDLCETIVTYGQKGKELACRILDDNNLANQAV